ncbi:CesT family type III secretion system chaperone [Acidovorax sp. CCYZU-2555]|uniref:CesT family type III secretion system chaperone n=1 Tax=Acidovorax sp. CCYZU-2555 TaxID=2835042 RepID=UPI001BD0C1A8|nr:CesT family type III secretion system chaperone [Acidovorax sp. CCYZU-2555]MBS7780631.1 CesT family type III secretion system chaperone [Acidovorax sp. CCYZU-2555]
MFAPYQDLLSALAEEVGLEASSLISSQEIVIDDLPISLKLEGEGEQAQLCLCCLLGIPSEGRWALAIRTMLQANHLWTGTSGATLGMLENHTVSLSVRRLLSELDADRLAVLLAKTADIGLAWQDFITQDQTIAVLPEFFHDAPHVPV